jgi:hypothetical protein
MPSTQLVPRQNPKTPRRQYKIRQQVDVHSLALEVETVSLMLSELRTRLSELERKFNTDKIMDPDRASLKNLDMMFVRANRLLVRGSECSLPSSLVRATKP